MSGSGGNGVTFNNLTSSTNSAFNFSSSNPSDGQVILLHDDLGPSTRLIVWGLVAASFVFLVLRLVCRFTRHRNIHLDDWILTISWLAVLAAAICVTIQIDLGLGKHRWDIPVAVETPANIVETSVLGLTFTTLGLLALAWTKTSFGLTLMRVQQRHHGLRDRVNRGTRIFLWFSIVALNLLLGMAALFLWIDCTPIEKAWKPSIEGMCWDKAVSLTYLVIVDAFSGVMDLILAILPFQLIMGLRMEFKEKLGIILAMVLGVGAAASALIKCASLPMIDGKDFPHSIVPIVIWTVAECAITIIAVSVPELRVFLHLKRHGKSRKGHHDYATGSSRRHLVSNGGSGRWFFNKPRRDLVPMTGSTWAGRSAVRTGG